MTAIYVIFRNPESNQLECGRISDYHEIKYYAYLRGFSAKDFKVIDQRMCRSKKEVANFEAKIKQIPK